jgi:hypothetical protein
MEVCVQGHAKGTDRHIDPHGNHANGGCLATSKGKHVRHRLINEVVRFYARKAGFGVKSEPDTATDLLHGTRHVKALFPKNVSKEMAQSVADLTHIIERAELLPRGPERKVLDEKAERLAELIEADANGLDKAGLRLDLQIIEDRKIEILVDVTVTSSTNKTNLNREYKHARGECKEEDGVRSGVSPALVARQKQKHVKYGPLMAKIVKVRADDSQPIPKFYAAAVTTHGEFSSDFLELILSSELLGHTRVV